MPAVVLPSADLPFPGSLTEFQRLFPDDTACAAYLEAIRWRDGLVCGSWRASSELGYRKNRHQIWCSWVSTGQAWSKQTALGSANQTEGKSSGYRDLNHI